jgi:dolichyl-phosphate-mannose-protein mannosyltransferase
MIVEQDPKARKVNYHRPSFWSKFWELQTVMWQTNKALVQHHAYSSSPISWPILKRGMNLLSFLVFVGSRFHPH